MKAERWLVAQTIGTVVLCSWAMGGRASWAPLATLAASLLSFVPLAFIWHTRRHEYADRRLATVLRPPSPVSLLPFLPLALYALYVGVSLLNPSHVMAPDGDWVPREGWMPWLPTSLDRARTLQGMLPWLAALMQAGAVAAGLESQRSFHQLTLGLVVNVLLLSLVGSVFWFAGAQQMLGEIAVPSSSFFGTFIYKNHWAAFALLGAATAAGVAFAAWDRVHEDRRAADVRTFAFCAVFLILLTIPLPGSRSGTALALLLTLMIFTEGGKRWSAVFGFSYRRRIGALVGSTVAALAVASWVVVLQWPTIQQAWNKSVGQWAVHQSGGRFDTRLVSAYDTWRMAQARPWFGWGTGSFDAVFPLFQGNYGRNADGMRTVTYNAAHCDWAQVPAELGFVGATILMGSILAAVRLAWQRRRRSAKWILLGCALIGLYAVADFPLQNPAVLLLMAVLLAAAASGKTVGESEIMPARVGRSALDQPMPLSISPETER